MTHVLGLSLEAILAAAEATLLLASSRLVWGSSTQKVLTSNSVMTPSLAARAMPNPTRSRSGPTTTARYRKAQAGVVLAYTQARTTVPMPSTARQAAAS